MHVRRNGEWLSASVGAESVMMSIETGAYVALTRVGARIWELVERPMAVSVLCARLAEEFDVTPEVCRTEVEAFLADLQNARAIVMEPLRS